MTMEPMYYGIDMEATGEDIFRLRKASGSTVKDVQKAMDFTSPAEDLRANGIYAFPCQICVCCEIWSRRNNWNHFLSGKPADAAIFRNVPKYSAATKTVESRSATGCAQTSPNIPKAACRIKSAGM